MGEQYYVYAIAASERHLPEGASHFGSPLLILPHGELGAVVSRVHPAEVEDITSAVSPEHLLRHEAVVEAVCAGGPALPVRFGTVLPDADAVQRALATHYSRLRDDLRRIGDKIELGVTALWPPTTGQSAALVSDQGASRATQADAVMEPHRPGVAYMHARQKQYQQAQTVRERAQALGRELDAALGPCTIERRRTVCPSERLALRDIYLLERERQSAFDMALAGVRTCHQEVRLLVSGPWPPYSFVTSPSRDVSASLQGGDRVT